MRLLVTVLAAVALSSQHIVRAQCSRQCSCGSPDGSWSPLYRTLTSPLPSENDIVPRAPPRCSCGCSPHRPPPRLPNPSHYNDHQFNEVRAFSGFVTDTEGFQQVGPASDIRPPPDTYVSSLDDHSCSPHRLPSRLPNPSHNNDHQFNAVPAFSGFVTDSEGFQQVGPATDIRPPPDTYVSSLDDHGCYPHRLPPRLPTPSHNNDHHFNAVPTLSGLVTDSEGLQQVGSAADIDTPPDNYVSSLDDLGSSSQTCDTSRHHIMTIPRRQDSSIPYNSYEAPSNSINPTDDASSSITFSSVPIAKPSVDFSSSSDESPITTTYPTTPQQMSCQPPSSKLVTNAPQFEAPPPPAANQPNYYPHPSPPAPQPNYSAPPSLSAPQPIYFAQPAPIFASCPATLFYPAAPAMTCAQANFACPVTPSYSPAPAVPAISQAFIPETSHHSTYSITDRPSTTTYSTTPSVGIPSNVPQTVPSSSATFTTETLHNTPSNTVSCSSTSDVQQTLTSSNPLETPSQSIFFGKSDSSGGAGALTTPETTGTTVSTHDAPLTYTLLTSSTNSQAIDDNRDCSVPIPPNLV